MTTDAKELVKKAFEMAHRSRKPEWHRMTTAVLKNRLLALTKNQFNEANFGARNMMEFAQNLADIVTLDNSSLPTVVELIQPSSTDEFGNSAKYSTTYDRIRPDLWQAIMDYQSGMKYVWDSDRGLARPQAREDALDLLMPTISANEDMRWRKEFAADVDPGVDDVARGRLAVFKAQSVSPKVLPTILLHRWNEFVKARILKRLADWAGAHKVTLPDRPTISASRPMRLSVESSPEHLRDFIVNCVRVMSPDELRAVNLPASVVLRVRKERP